MKRTYWLRIRDNALLLSAGLAAFWIWLTVMWGSAVHVWILGVAVALLLWELVSLLHRWSLGSPVRSLIGEAVWVLCLVFLCGGIATALWVLIRILGVL